MTSTRRTFFRRGLALTLALAAPACTSVQEPRIHDSSGDDSGVTAEAVQPTLELAASGAHEGGAAVTLTNPTSAAWTFHGYGPGAPIFTLENRTADGWTPHQLGWCGTGLEQQVLPPGARLTFTVPFDGTVETRVLVALVGPDGATVRLASPPLAVR